MIKPNFQEFVASLNNFRSNEAVGIKRMFRTEVLTYGQLQENIYKTAHWLLEIGLKSDDRIVVAAPNMPEWCTLFLAAQITGITVVPCDVRSSQKAIEDAIETTKPKLVVRGRHFFNKLDQDHETFLLENLHDQVARKPASPPEKRLSGEETAVVMFTSGTTGAPKGVVLSQNNILENVASLAQALPVQSSWRFLSILPFSHTYEITVGFLTPLTGGAAIFYVARIAPLAIARALRDHQITSMVAVPQMLALFKKSIEERAQLQGQYKVLKILLKIAHFLPIILRKLLFTKIHKQLGKLDFVATGGAPVDAEVTEFWENLGVKVLQGYGLTETSPVLTINTLQERNFHSQGKVLPGVKLRLSDSHEIQAKGPNVFSQYFKDKQKTKAVFTEDGWFKTGDIAEVDEEGWYYIRGRSKFMIVLSSGLKVLPEDIEPIINKLPLLTEAVIVGAEKPSGEEVYIVVRSDASDKKIQKAIDEANNLLETHQRISGWLRWEAEDFPRSRLLKIDRRKVWDWANQQVQGKKVSASKMLEEPKDKIQEIIARVLEKPPKKITDDAKLIELGLDSLRRLTVVSLIEEQMSVSIPEYKITAKTTVKELRKLTEKGEVVEQKIKRPKWPYWRATRIIGGILREILLPITWLAVGIKVKGKNNLKDVNRPAIFIFNHSDNLDVPVLYRSLPFKIRNKMAPATATDVIREHLLLSIVGRLCFGAFDFARKEPFMPSLENMARLIDRGWNIAIAPEGRISPTGKLLEFKSGTGMMAVEMQAQVVPVKIEGLHGTMPVNSKFPRRRSRVAVKIGRPIIFDKLQSYDEATQQLQKMMEDL